MEIMDDKTKDAVGEVVSTMIEPVHILVFTEEECQHCKETLKIVEELSSIADVITCKELKLEESRELADEYKVDKAPAILVMRGTPEKHEYLGVRFFGIPSGYEFTSLLDSIVTASTGDIKLSDEAVEYLKALEKDLHIEVFVTPTCPYCPRAVVFGHHMAMAGRRVVADMVEATEFQELSQKYGVMGVPRTVINGKVHQEGAAPEGMILDKIREALG